MPFEARINMPEDVVPARCYVHIAGLAGAYSRFASRDGVEGLVEAACVIFKGTLSSIDAPRFRSYDFLVGVVWGDNVGERFDQVIDFIGYRSLDSCRKIYMVDCWNVRNGVWVKKGFSTCPESLVTFAGEIEFLRRSSSFEIYRRNVPDLGILQPVRELTY